jgi:GT2 family glycosyltransferase
VTVQFRDSRETAARGEPPAETVHARGPAVTVCVLLFGDYPRLAAQTLNSIARYAPRPDYRLIVGANAVSRDSLNLLDRLQNSGTIDDVIVSPSNLNKCPMMRRLFERVNTELIWWFDDDSYLTGAEPPEAWLKEVRSSAPSTVMWGKLSWCDSTIGFNHFNERTTLEFVRSAAWYRGLPPPSWRPGGKGEFDFQGRGTGDGRWYYLAGGCWMIRSETVRALDWPDPRLVKMGDDTFLGEAIRQQGWKFKDIGSLGVAINTEPRRGERG